MTAPSGAIRAAFISESSNVSLTGLRSRYVLICVRPLGRRWIAISYPPFPFRIFRAAAASFAFDFDRPPFAPAQRGHWMGPWMVQIALGFAFVVFTIPTSLARTIARPNPFGKGFGV